MPGAGAVPGRRGCVRERADSVRAEPGRTADGELSSVVASWVPELRRMCGGPAPRGDCGDDMAKERMGECANGAVCGQDARAARIGVSECCGRSWHAMGNSNQGSDGQACGSWVPGQRAAQCSVVLWERSVWKAEAREAAGYRCWCWRQSGTARRGAVEGPRRGELLLARTGVAAVGRPRSVTAAQGLGTFDGGATQACWHGGKARKSGNAAGRRGRVGRSVSGSRAQRAGWCRLVQCR